MNTPSNTLPPASTQGETPLHSPLSPVRPMYWSIRRELWENRFLYMAPLVITAVVLFASVMNVLIRTATGAKGSGSGDSESQFSSIAGVIGMAPAPIMFSTILVGFFYCLDALYGERRDRSILFWKSLPVSDRTTVLSKAGIPLVVLPLIAFALSVLIQLILLPTSSVVLAAAGVGPAPLWSRVRFFEGLPIMIYGLTVHALWYAPIYGWLILLSAWVRRATFLWALLPLLAIMAVERITLGTGHFLSILQYRMSGAMSVAFDTGTDGNIERLSQLTPVKFLTTPGLWLGLLFAAACLSVAVRLRRYREPI